VSDALTQALHYLDLGYLPVPCLPNGSTWVNWREMDKRPPTESRLRDYFEDRSETMVKLALLGGLCAIRCAGDRAEALLVERGLSIPPGAPAINQGNVSVFLLRGFDGIKNLTEGSALFTGGDAKSPDLVEVHVGKLVAAPPSEGTQWFGELPLFPELPEVPAPLAALIQDRIKEVEEKKQGGAHWAAVSLRGVDSHDSVEEAHRLCGYLNAKGLPLDVSREIMMAFADRCHPLPMLVSDVDAIMRRREWDGNDDGAERPGVVWHEDEIEAHVEMRLKPVATSWVAPTPLPSVNQALRGGFKGGRIYLVAGEPGAGKTALVIQTLVRAAKAGIKSFMVSAEMPRDSIYDREIAAEGQLDVGKVEDGLADPHAMAYVAEKLSGLPIALANNSVRCVQDIVDQVKLHEPKLVVVDYLQLIAHDERGRDTRERVEAVSKGLKGLAKREGCAVVCVSSLTKKDSKRAGEEMPTNDRLRESGALHFDADGILLLGRENGQTKCALSKNKYGPIGTFDMEFKGSTMSFTEKGGADVPDGRFPDDDAGPDVLGEVVDEFF